MKYSTTHQRLSDETSSHVRRRKAPQRRAGRTIAPHMVAKNWLALCVAFVCLALLVTVYPRAVEGNKAGPQTKGGERQVQGVKVQAAASAVVNFQELARQQALNPQVSNPTPKAITPPLTIEEVEVGKGEAQPPVPAPVDIPGPSVPSPAPATSFAGIDDIAAAGTGSFFIPPDTTGAVGTDAVNKVFGNLNNNYRVQNKTTGATIGADVSMTTFWTPASATSPFDPRVQYDPFNDRWIVAGVSDAGSATTSILVGISLTSDPSGAFTLFKVSARIAGDPAATNFADFPMLGFNKNWVVVSINMFGGTPSAFTDGRSLVIDYPMLRTGVLSATYFTGILAGSAGFCMHPATTYSATEATEYLVAHLSSGGATYKMDTITGTSAAPVFTLGVTKTRAGGAWAVVGGNILPQAMGTCATPPLLISGGDQFIRQNVVFRNSSIWYAQTVGLPSSGLTHTAAQWTQLNTSGDVLQGGRVEDPTATATNGGKWYAFPSIAANAGGDALLGFSEFSSATFASAGYTYRDHTDTLGTMRDVFIFKAGEDCYSKDFSTGRNRWGDYSHTMVDPTGNANFWTIQEYAKLQAPPSVGGSTSKWGTWWAKVNALVPTMAKVNSFTADGFDDGRVLLRWRSGYEVDNLGYNVYRETNGQRTKINPQIIAGSALVTGPKVALTAGRAYAWGDDLKSSSSPRYWLEDLDLNGNSNWTGPVSLNTRRGKAPTLEQAVLLSRIGLAQAQMTLGQGSAPVEFKAAIAALAPAAMQLQTDLAGQPAVKLSVNREGWYRVTQPELIAAGLDPKVNPRFLQVFVDGREVPISVQGEQDGKFDAADSVGFYGVGLDAASSDTRLYWLAAGSQPGQRIEKLQTNGTATAATSFAYPIERKDRTIYFSGLRNGDAENFFGPVIAREPVDQTLTLQRINKLTPANAQLEITLQGVTQQAHQVKVFLNGADVGAVNFGGQAKGVASLPVPHSRLIEGDNVVRLVAQAGETDVSLVDTLRITYQHTYNAESNALRLPATGAQQITVDGFTSSDVRVFDVTNTDALQEVAAVVQAQKGGYAVTATAPGSGQRTLFALTGARARQVLSARANQPSSWRQPSNGANLLIITHRDFASSTANLKSLRQSQGLSVAVIDVEDLYDEFSTGNKTPQAVKDFLAYAKGSWKKPPQYALLVGDASLDPKNYLGYGDSDYVPTRLLDTQYMETASDDWLADFSGGGVAELAIGRLPVRTAQEAMAMIQKIVAYDGSARSESVLLVVDRNDGFNFENSNTLLRGLIPPDLRIEEVDRNGLDDATAKSQLLEAINRGQKIVNYMGHGSVDNWHGQVLTNDDALGLTNSRLSLFITMTCLNGYYQDPVLDGLAEALMKAERGGAVAVWASSGMTVPGNQLVLNQQMYRLVFDTSLNLTLGEAVMRAKALVNDPDVRRTWILFGDPSLRLK